MSVDVFGRHLNQGELKSKPGPPGIGFKLTVDNNFDINGKRLCNVSTPIESNDAVNAKALDLVKSEINQRIQNNFDDLSQTVEEYREDVDKQIAYLMTNIINIAEKAGVPLIPLNVIPLYKKLKNKDSTSL